jgi:hypothetical protein
MIAESQKNRNIIIIFPLTISISSAVYNNNNNNIIMPVTL